MIKTITTYDPITGEFGPIYSLLEEDITIAVGDKPYLEGAYYTRSQRYNINLGLVEEKEVKPYLIDLKAQRDHLLDSYRWTIMPDSPLTNKDEWLLYLQTLQTLLKDVTPETTDQVIWPEKPPYIYA